MIYDYIIIGSGVAGLAAVKYIPNDKKVLIVCKKTPWECNTFYAQGGISCAVDEDDIDGFMEDTLKAGAYYNKKEAVKKLCSKSIEVVGELIKSGMEFDKNSKNQLALTKEGAHSKNRILHANGDATGRVLHMFLLEQCSFDIISDSIVIDLLIKDNICYGVHIIKDKKDEILYAHNIVIASGGVGSIYKYHTNSTTISGDIQGICIEKNIKLKDMEMMQFHPTVFIESDFARKQLLSEALRGEGAIIEDSEGYRFLKEYHLDSELAPRDIVSRAIFDYVQKYNTKVYLSFKNFTKKEFKKRFPNIYNDLKKAGFDLPYERIPISPAFHYSMGGIEVDLDSKVIGFENLYAIGEVANTGVHGANRLASNSLLEGLVFSKEAIKKSLKNNFKIDKDIFKEGIKYYQLVKDIDKPIKNALRDLMWKKVSIIRYRQDLFDALDEINSYLEEDIGRLLYLRLLTAKSIVQSAIDNKKSIGAHFINTLNPN